MHCAPAGFWLGTGSLGRDVLTRILHGARIALIVEFEAGTITCVIGATLGLIAGFFRGWADRIISRLVDIWMAFPPVLFAILLIVYGVENWWMPEIKALHDGSNIYMTEYGTIYQPSGIATYSMDLSLGNLRLLSFPASSNSTTFKVVYSAINN